MSLDKDGTYLVLDYDKGPGTIMVKHIPSNDFFSGAVRMIYRTTGDT